jgi:BirA family biotin operon repressor/biotin-[acetyl-CoA-carboxylase] ligase
MLSKIVAISVLKTLKKHLSADTEIKIKWPNDIYVNKRKISGILIENSIQNSRLRKTVIGIGININQTRFPEKLNAISICDIIKKESDLKPVLDDFCGFMEQNLTLLKSSQTTRINEFYTANLF